MRARPPGGLPLAPALAAFASGLLLAAATPPSPSVLLPFVALVPLAAAIASLPAGSPGASAALGLGMLAGGVEHAWGLRWLPGTLTAVAGGTAGWAAFTALVGVLAAFTGAAAWALHRLVCARRPLPLALALPVVWTGFEWSLGHLPLGLAFRWAPLGLGLTAWPASLGLAEGVGVAGVTAWLATAAGLAASGLAAFSRGGRARSGPLLVAAAALAAAPVALGTERAARLVTPAEARVAALGLDVPPGLAPLVRAAAGVEAAERELAALEPGAVALVALPEMTLTVDPLSPAGAPLLARLREVAAGVGAPLLVGALGSGEGRFYNAAMLVRQDGLGAFRADKRHLVPGVEAGGGGPAWLAPAGSGGYTPGRGWPVARLGDVAAGVLLCYEVAFSGDAVRLVRGGARVLVALTSDAWFGGGAGARRAGIEQQMAHLVLRAVETRTGAVRASTGGPTALVAPNGHVERRGGAGVLTGVVRAVDEPTFYVRTGDLVGPLAALLLVMALIACGGTGRRAPG